MSNLLAEFKATAARLEILAAALADKCKIPDEPAPGPVPTIRQIVEIVARSFKVTRGQILGAQRNPAFVTPRHIAMYLAREMTLHSLPAIGRFMGGRDHTTVLHAVRKVDYQLKFDAELGPVLETLRNTIRAEILPP